jgi:hypothetical protein
MKNFRIKTFAGDDLIISKSENVPPVPVGDR